MPRTAPTECRDLLLGCLRGCGFDDAPRSRLGLGATRDLLQTIHLARRRRSPSVAASRTDADADALDLLVALFLFGRRVPRARLGGALGRETVAALEETQLASAEAGRLAPNVLLFPCHGLYLATDRLDDNGGTNRVMPLFAESYDLALVTVRQPVARALDLGTGSGVHALLSSRHAAEAVGVDLSPRATSFARFNAWLNGIENTCFLEGDLYAPVRRRERFGLITANPPYNPELGPGAGENWHSGGESGEEVLARIVAGIPDHLDDDGFAQIITLLIRREGDDFEPRIRRWLGDRGATMDVLLLARDVNYRPRILAGEPGLSPAERALYESWRRQHIVGFQFGVINFRWSPRGRRPVLLTGPFGDQGGPPSELDVARALEAAR